MVANILFFYKKLLSESSKELQKPSHYLPTKKLSD